jgi:nucleoid-associated protein YgaU
MELFLDDFTDIQGPTSLRQKETDPVAKRLRAISKLLEIDRDLHAPSPVRFNWGPLEFSAVIEKLGRKVTKFHPDGTPARATLTVSFKEYRTLSQQLREPRRESSDKTKRRVVVGRDRLWTIAAKEYGDPNEWVRIAEANDLDDPREIAPGDWLKVPPIENPDGTGNAL